MKRFDSIYLRLIVPLGLTLLIAMLAAWAIAVKLLTDTIDDRLDEQLDHATEMLADGEFPLGPNLIGRLDRLIGARIALVSESGDVALSTAPDAAHEALLKVTNNISASDSTDLTLLSSETDDTAWRIAVRPLALARDSRYQYVAAIASLEESRQAARDAAKLLGAAMLLVTILLAWVGHHFTDLAQQSRLAGLGDLAARIAHEIRNPLTAIKMQLQLLEQETPTSDAARVGKLLNEIRRMEMMVESTLTLGAPLVLQRLDMRPDELIGDLADLLRPALEHRGIDLQTAIEFDEVISADRHRLQQALINLINNAADELKAGGTILLGTRATENPATIEFRVEDSGPGVAATSGKSDSDKPFGLGLGLTICREIAEHHGGKLIADASPSLGGARFTIRMPKEKS